MDTVSGKQLDIARAVSEAVEGADFVIILRSGATENSEGAIIISSVSAEVSKTVILTLADSLRKESN